MTLQNIYVIIEITQNRIDADNLVEPSDLHDAYGYEF